MSQRWQGVLKIRRRSSFCLLDMICSILSNKSLILGLTASTESCAEHAEVSFYFDMTVLFGLGRGLVERADEL